MFNRGENDVTAFLSETLLVHQMRCVNKEDYAARLGNRHYVEMTYDEETDQVAL